MRCRSVQINNFRSVKFVILNLSRITVLAGKNSSGKSNILRGIEVVLKQTNHRDKILADDLYPDSTSIHGNLDIVLSYADKEHIISHINRKLPCPKPIMDFFNNSHYRLMYTAELNKTRAAYYLGYKKTTKYHDLFGRGASKDINISLLNKFQSHLNQYYSYIQLNSSFASISDAQHDQMAGTILSQFTSGNPEERAKYNKLRDLLFYITEGIGGEIQPAKFTTDQHTVAHRLRYEVERKLFVPVINSGDGAQRVALILHYLINMPNELIAIEEPELCLHPGAQRRFRKVLDQLSNEFQKQLIITTHSPIFIDGWESASLYKVEIEKGTTVVSSVQSQEQTLKLVSNLGIKPSDAFMADGIIWVEGPSDIGVYRTLLRKVGVDLDERNILFMSTGGSILQHLSAKDLRFVHPNFIILLDSDKTDARKQPDRWKINLIEELSNMGAYGYITKRREIENYFSLNAVCRYYKCSQAGLSQIPNYEDFGLYVASNLPGMGYKKTRDAFQIAEHMTLSELEKTDDLYEAILNIRSTISKWKAI